MTPIRAALKTAKVLVFIEQKYNAFDGMFTRFKCHNTTYIPKYECFFQVNFLTIKYFALPSLHNVMKKKIEKIEIHLLNMFQTNLRNNNY